MFVVSNALAFALVAPSWGSANCPNELFRTGAGASLPDCRAYEQVSPKDKNGGNVDGGGALETEPAPQQATPDGESVTYASQTPFNEGQSLSAPVSSQYLATRGPDGWHTVAIDPPQEWPFGQLDANPGNLEESLFQGFNEDLSHGYLAATNPQPVSAAPEGHFNPYLRDNLLGSYALLAPLGPPTSTPEEPDCCKTALKAIYAGMSDDGKHVIFAVNAALTPEAVEGKVNLYEWNEGALELVSVLPGGVPDNGGGTDVTESVLRYGGASEEEEQAAHFSFGAVLSSDGHRAFWTGSNRRLYMHELTAAGARTVDISSSQKAGAAPETEEYTHFWTASANGELVYFTSCQQLTDDSTAIEGIGSHGNCVTSQTTATGGLDQDLYQYNVATGKLTDITVDPHPGKTADVQGVLGASEDGSYVYFAARGALTEGAIEAANSSAEAFDVYVWHDGVLRLVTTLEEQPNGATAAESHAWDRPTKNRISRVSPNGRFLAFESAQPLTEGATTTPGSPGGCDVVAKKEGFEESFEHSDLVERIDQGGRRCIQVYLYDAAADKLVCASCAADGFPPDGNSIVPDTATALQPNLGWGATTRQQRYLLNDGRLYFDSTASLVPQDTNQQEDVYEYEPVGTGGCSGSSACLSLVSSGISTVRSQFVDSDSEGANVFFTTNEPLVAGDGDEQADLYDARIDGGFIESTAPPCGGEACKPAAIPAPSIYGAPSSQAFTGAGNAVAQAPPVKAKPKKKASKPKRKRSEKKGNAGKRAGRDKARRSRVRIGKGRDN